MRQFRHEVSSRVGCSAGAKWICTADERAFNDSSDLFIVEGDRQISIVWSDMHSRDVADRMLRLTGRVPHRNFCWKMGPAERSNRYTSTIPLLYPRNMCPSRMAMALTCASVLIVHTSYDPNHLP